MGFRIEDGTGQGRYARVDSDNRLEVAALTLPLIAERSHNGDAYSVVGEHTIQSTGTEEHVLHIQNNNSNKHVHFSNITISAETSTLLDVEFMVATTYTSGGTAKTPVQLNRGSAKLSGLVAYDNSSNDLVIADSLEEKFCGAKFGSTMTVQMSGGDAVILGPGDSMLVQAYGTSGDVVGISAFVYETLEVD